jgi:hypothetical protein
LRSRLFDLDGGSDGLFVDLVEEEGLLGADFLKSGPENSMGKEMKSRQVSWTEICSMEGVKARRRRTSGRHRGGGQVLCNANVSLNTLPTDGSEG